MHAAATRPYRLGLDVGSNSIGWFVIWLNDKGQAAALGPGGVRIFPDGRDPQSKTSNAVSRRVARGARRRRDRYLRRRADLMATLVANGLMPAEEAERKALEVLDPYELRARALDEPLPAAHVGRALFHLNQRRGFLSNRKTEKANDDAGLIKQAATRLETAMRESGARTIGEFMYRRHRVREPVRARKHGTGKEARYDFYPTRALLRQEFDAIWSAQAPHHAAMTEEARSAIERIIFYQRPLKQPPVGKCALDPAQSQNDPDGFRCPWAHPLAQRFRIWQEVRNLAVVEAGKPSRALNKEDGDRIQLALLQQNKLSFDKIRGMLKLPQTARFNLESEKRRHLNGDETAAKLAGRQLFGKAWRGYPVDRQIEIVDRLLNEIDEDALVAWLAACCGLDEATAERVANATLPDGHCRLGLRAIRALLPHMASGLNYPDAARAAGYDHARRATGELRDRLPYYGEWLSDDVVGTGDPRDPKEKRWGRVPNPTVHIGLGQLRRVVNALIRRHGAPVQITIELTRGFRLSPKQLAELEREQAENQRRNDRRRQEIEAQGQPANHRNLLKLRLWEELNPKDPLDRRCPFTGEQIGIARLLSDEVDIEHLIPFADSWDDSAANKVVCMRYANRAKGNRTPYEAFGASPTIDGRRYDWNDIAARADGLPKNKRWRFAPDARERFKAMGGFLGRQLNETGWLARMAKDYLGAVTDPNKVNVLPGRLTAMIRAKWALDELLPDHNFTRGKNRTDHRHHAIDALVAGLTDRSLLHRMSSAYDEERERIDVPLPWPGLRDDVKARLDEMVVSYKPEHGLLDKLHEETAYGSVRHPENEDGNLVYRKDFLSLNENEIARIRDLRLRGLVQAHVAREMAAGRKLAEALASFNDTVADPQIKHGLRRVRLLKRKEPAYLVSVRDRNGRPFKAYSAGNNAYVEIFETPDGKWRGEGVTVFQANQAGFAPAWRKQYPDARMVMRVFKDDLLSIEHEGVERIVRVVRLEPSAKRLRLAEHKEAGSLQARHDDPADPFHWIFGTYDRLQAGRARRVRVDELGRVWRVDPEPASGTPE